MAAHPRLRTHSRPARTRSNSAARARTAGRRAATAASSGACPPSSEAAVWTATADGEDAVHGTAPSPAAPWLAWSGTFRSGRVRRRPGHSGLPARRLRPRRRGSPAIPGSSARPGIPASGCPWRGSRQQRQATPARFIEPSRSWWPTASCPPTTSNSSSLLWGKPHEYRYPADTAGSGRDQRRSRRSRTREPGRPRRQTAARPGHPGRRGRGLAPAHHQHGTDLVPGRQPGPHQPGRRPHRGHAG